MSAQISVILTIYNAAESLGQCLDTLLTQTLTDIEVLCIDGHSTDGSQDIVKTYAMFDERVKLIEEKNKNLSFLKNVGIKKASGEFLAFMSTDDFYPENDILESLYTAAKNNKVSVCGGELAFFNPKTFKLTPAFNEQSLGFFQNSEILDYDFYQCDENFPCFIYQKKLIDENHFSFPENVCVAEGVFLVSALTKAKKFYGMKKTVYAQRKDEYEEEHWNKDKVKEFFLNEVEKLKIAHEMKYHFLKTNCLTKMRAIFPFVQKYFSRNEWLNLLKTTNFLYENKKVKVSLIIAAYNAEKYIEKCLKSALNQTLKEIEIICVNDGSTDTTGQIIQEFAQKDKRITVINQENLHLGIARNNAFKKASGEYIEYLDADDWLDPEACETLYLYAKLFGLEMLSFATKNIEERNQEEYESGYTNFTYLPDRFIPVFNVQSARSILPNMAVSSALTFYNREFLINNDLTWCNLNYEDTLFFTQALFSALRVGVLKEQLYYRLMHSNSVTASVDQNYSDYCQILKKTFEFIHEVSDLSMLNYYIHVYMTKAYQILLRLPPEIQNKYMADFYDLSLEVIQKYHLHLPFDIEKMLKVYVHQFLSFKKKVEFYLSMGRIKCIKNAYQLNLIDFKSYTGGFMLKILGIPVLFKKPAKYHGLLN